MSDSRVVTNLSLESVHQSFKPVYQAALEKNKATLEALYDKGYFLDALERNGLVTVAGRLVIEKNYDAVICLLECGASPHFAALAAAWHGDRKYAEYLYNMWGASPNAILQGAALGCHDDYAAWLIKERGALPEYRDFASVYYRDQAFINWFAGRFKTNKKAERFNGSKLCFFLAGQALAMREDKTYAADLLPLVLRDAGSVSHGYDMGYVRTGQQNNQQQQDFFQLCHDLARHRKKNTGFLSTIEKKWGLFPEEKHCNMLTAMLETVNFSESYLYFPDAKLKTAIYTFPFLANRKLALHQLSMVNDTETLGATFKKSRFSRLVKEAIKINSVRHLFGINFDQGRLFIECADLRRLLFCLPFCIKNNPLPFELYPLILSHLVGISPDDSADWIKNARLMKLKLLLDADIQSLLENGQSQYQERALSFQQAVHASKEEGTLLSKLAAEHRFFFTAPLEKSSKTPNKTDAYFEVLDKQAHRMSTLLTNQ